MHAMRKIEVDHKLPGAAMRASGSRHELKEAGTECPGSFVCYRVTKGRKMISSRKMAHLCDCRNMCHWMGTAVLLRKCAGHWISYGVIRALFEGTIFGVDSYWRCDVSIQVDRSLRPPASMSHQARLT